MVGRLILALLVVLALAAPAAADELSISGEITYRERIALPADSILHLRLVDMGRLEAPAVVEAEAPIATPGRVPLTFTLRFDESLIQADRSYAIAAEITSAGALWFSSFSPHPVDPIVGTVPEPIVLTFAGRIDGTDEPAPAAPPVPDDADDAALLDIVWRAETIGGEAIDPALEASLSVGSDLRAGGRGGCNSYYAQVWLEGEHLQFSAIAATKMACSNPAVTELETQFFSALEATRFWRLAGEELLLLDDTGRELVRFGRPDR
jgi:putative lipoprotein